MLGITKSQIDFKSRVAILPEYEVKLVSNKVNTIHDINVAGTIKPYDKLSADEVLKLRDWKDDTVYPIPFKTLKEVKIDDITIDISKELTDLEKVLGEDFDAFIENRQDTDLIITINPSVIDECSAFDTFVEDVNSLSKNKLNKKYNEKLLVEVIKSCPDHDLPDWLKETAGPKRQKINFLIDKYKIQSDA